jgi:hypothetical protein
MAARKEGKMQEPAFEEWAIVESAAIDTAIAAYRQKRIARKELVERVRGVVDQYDGLSREAIFEDIEATLGENIPEFWSSSQVSAWAEATGEA